MSSEYDEIKDFFKNLFNKNGWLTITTINSEGDITGTYWKRKEDKIQFKIMEFGLIYQETKYIPFSKIVSISLKEDSKNECDNCKEQFYAVFIDEKLCQECTNRVNNKLKNLPNDEEYKKFEKEILEVKS